MINDNMTSLWCYVLFCFSIYSTFG